MRAKREEKGLACATKTDRAIQEECWGEDEIYHFHLRDGAELVLWSYINLLKPHIPVHPGPSSASSWGLAAAEDASLPLTGRDWLN